MNNFIKKILLLITFVLSIISFYNIHTWYKWYTKKYFEFAVDLDYFLEEDIKIEQLINRFNKIGIKNFFVNIDYLNDIPISTIHDRSLIIKFLQNKRYNLDDLFNFFNTNTNKIFSLYIEDKKNICQDIKLYKLQPSKTKKLSEQDLLSFVKTYKLKKLNFERNNINNSLISYRPSIRSFLLNLNEEKINSTDYLNILNLKIKKAIFERSCSLIYIVPSELLDSNQNFEVISSIISNFSINFPNNYQYFDNFDTINFGRISNIIGILVAILLPVLIFDFYYKKINNFSAESIFFLINIIIVLFGVILWGFLQKYEYISLEENIHGIKLAFILPVVLSIFFILNKKEIKNLLDYELRIKHILVFFVIFLILSYIFIRTNNVDKRFLLPYESFVRNLIEKHILFRPRFKEVFFTQPLLFISINLLKNKNNLWTKLLYCLSILSSSSIINTFLHIHTPIWLCIGRSLLGVMLGFLIGKILYLVINKL